MLIYDGVQLLIYHRGDAGADVWLVHHLYYLRCQLFPLNRGDFDVVLIVVVWRRPVLYEFPLYVLDPLWVPSLMPL